MFLQCQGQATIHLIFQLSNTSPAHMLQETQLASKFAAATVVHFNMYAPEGDLKTAAVASMGSTGD